jgi:uncharacterized membrane protein YcaP (DUF421 family)
MWFSPWSDLARILLVGAAAYVTLIVILRTSGKRTLAKLNAFDLVVTVALGSTLATIFLDKNVTWSQGGVALATLALLQFVVAALTTRFGGRAAVTSSPTLLVQRGQVLRPALRVQRVTEAEVWQAIRSSGVGDLAMVAAAVLETDGTISVITEQRAGSRSALRDVPNAFAE